MAIASVDRAILSHSPEPLRLNPLEQQHKSAGCVTRKSHELDFQPIFRPRNTPDHYFCTGTLGFNEQNARGVGHGEERNTDIGKDSSPHRCQPENAKNDNEAFNPQGERDVLPDNTASAATDF